MRVGSPRTKRISKRQSVSAPNFCSSEAKLDEGCLSGLRDWKS